MGFTVDIAIGTFLDRCAKALTPTLATALQDQDLVNSFVEQYNAKNNKDPIPLGYFDGILLDSSMHGGQLLEKLARYGDPAEFPLPIPKRLDVTANMSYAGLETAVHKHLFQSELDGRKLSQYERIRREYTLGQVCDLSSSIQFAAFFQV